jgi:hypothetical protein
LYLDDKFKIIFSQHGFSVIVRTENGIFASRNEEKETLVQNKNCHTNSRKMEQQGSELFRQW